MAEIEGKQTAEIEAKHTAKAKPAPQIEMKEAEEEGMGFWDHLEVLRWALFRVACCITLCTIGMFIAMPHIFDNYILAPTTNDFFVYQWLEQLSNGLVRFSDDFKVDIININVASQFMTHIHTSLALGAICTFPYIVYELWKFIRPALYDNEIRHVRPAFLGGTLMFFVGCAIGYLVVFPFTFRFLTEYQLSPSITNQINLSSYIGNFTMLIMVMGIVFEMPLLAWLLSQLGILRKHMLKDYRKHACVFLLVAAAFITPTSDPFTLMLVFVPLYVLYEVSIRVVKA